MVHHDLIDKEEVTLYLVRKSCRIDACYCLWWHLLSHIPISHGQFPWQTWSSSTVCRFFGSPKGPSLRDAVWDMWAKKSDTEGKPMGILLPFPTFLVKTLVLGFLFTLTVPKHLWCLWSVAPGSTFNRETFGPPSKRRSGCFGSPQPCGSAFATGSTLTIASLSPANCAVTTGF